MVARREISGLHIYDRRSGLHCLLDEVAVAPADAARCGPRQLSVALTKRCNLACHYCYSHNNGEEMPVPLFEDVCRAADAGQVLDVTLGGGEPSLHPRFAECARWAWSNFRFGISVTTNCTHVQPLLDAADCVSAVRVSLDPYKRQFAGVIRKNALRLSRACKVGVNMLFHPHHKGWAADTITALTGEGITDVLFLPEHSGGKYRFAADAWGDLAHLIRFAEAAGCSVKVTDSATRFVSGPFLVTSHPAEFLFAHVDQAGGICRRSWGPPVARAATRDAILSELQSLHPLRGTHENLAGTCRRPFL